MGLAENLKRIRKDNELSQEQFADKLGVSRQSVSKWESKQSYPEMEKILLICKIYNYNIDELMNENIKEIDEGKQSKKNQYRYFEKFMENITKTITLIANMTLKQKIKLILEEAIIVIILLIIFFVLGGIVNLVVNAIFSPLGYNIHRIVSRIAESLYFLIATIISIVIILQTFKVRYLDYFEFVREDKKVNEDEKTNQNKNNDKTIELKENTSRREKIIIRDPKDSEKSIFDIFFKLLIFALKLIVASFIMSIIPTFPILIMLLVFSLTFVKMKVTFVGAFIGILACIAINYTLLENGYNFIIDRKLKLKQMGLIILISLIVGGIGAGLIISDIPNYKYEKNIEVNNTKETKKEFDMTDNLVINSYEYLIPEENYIEKETNKVEIVIKHSEMLNFYIFESANEINISSELDSGNMAEGFKLQLEGIKNKKILNYREPTIYVYASKENISKLKENKRTIKQRKEKEHDKQKIKKLEKEVEQLEEKIESQERKLTEKTDEIERLKEDKKED